MNILLIAQNYHPFVGGVETQTRMFAQVLARRHRVAVAAGNFVPSRLPSRLAMLHTSLLTPSFAGYEDEGVPVHSLTPTPAQRLRMLPIVLRALPKVQRYAYHGLNRLGYRSFRAAHLPRLRALVEGKDVVHSLAGGYLGWAAQEAAREWNVPFVCSPYVHPHQWGDGPDDVAYYRRSQAVVALLETDRNYLASLGVSGEALHIVGVVPDLMPTSNPDDFRDRHGLGNSPTVLYVGRMMPQKGAKALLDAARSVWQHVPDAHFVFVGPGDALSDQWFKGCDPRIRSLGKVNAQEKCDALAACDVFCMPSTSEILPTVYLEAWSYGKAVVGGKADGLPELVEGNGAGLTVTQSPSDVAEALSSLLLDPVLRERMGQSGRSLVQQRYTQEAVVGSLEAIFENLCPNQGDKCRMSVLQGASRGC